MVVPAAVDHRQMPILIEPLEADHRRMKAKSMRRFQHFALRDAELRSRAVVRGIAIGHDRVQTVVAARQLDHDENSLGMRLDAGALERLRRQRRRRAAQHKRQSGADADAVQPADQKVATGTRRTHGHPFSWHLERSLPTCSNIDRRPRFAYPNWYCGVLKTRYSSSRSESSSSGPGCTRVVPSRPRRKSTSTARSFSPSGTDRNLRAR